MQTTQTTYQSMIGNAFLDRKAKNPSYSLRGFAKYLGVSKTALSDVLNGKRHLSAKNALKVADKLSLSPDQTKDLVAEARGTQVQSKPTLATELIDDDNFRMISDWYHYAILNLTRIKSNRADAHWIAKRLGITPLQARTAMLRLCRMGYLDLKEGKLVRTVAPLDTPLHVSTQAVRNYQKQNLRLAEVSIERDELERRYFSSMVLATRPERVLKAKKMISEFRERLTNYLECENPTDVYTLGIQVFPLTVKKREK